MNWALFILHVFTFQPLLSILNATLLHKMLFSSYLYPLSYAEGRLKEVHSQVLHLLPVATEVTVVSSWVDSSLNPYL